MTGVGLREGSVLSGGDPARSAPHHHAGTPTAPTAHQVAHTADVADAIRDAATSGVALRISAGAGWLGAGRPISAPTRVLDLRALRGIIEYNPGDLTLTARASTTLAEIEEATRPHGQWLPLDPFGVETDTLGATLATASCGPLASSLGLPRDLALGVEFVDGRGIVVRGGGRVVKNVAGFDLVRLTVGAWGTLGVITEVTVRLRARPEQVVSVALDLPDTPAALAPLLRALREAPLTPIAAELLSAPLGAACGAGTGAADVVVVRLAGNATSLTAQRRQIASFGDARDVPESTWDLLRRAFPSGAASVRLSHRPSRLAELWFDLATTSRDLSGELRHASVERGVARCVMPDSIDGTLSAQVAALASRWTVVGEQLPPEAWTCLRTSATDRLSDGVRTAFDPGALLNPGLMTSRR
ncbi:MAG: FAD-binding oxidoreductase [Gemmatimonadota bacterium]